jgi:hypothetical protein
VPSFWERIQVLAIERDGLLEGHIRTPCGKSDKKNEPEEKVTLHRKKLK